MAPGPQAPGEMLPASPASPPAGRCCRSPPASPPAGRCCRSPSCVSACWSLLRVPSWPPLGDQLGDQGSELGGIEQLRSLSWLLGHGRLGSNCSLCHVSPTQWSVILIPVSLHTTPFLSVCLFAHLLLYSFIGPFMAASTVNLYACNARAQVAACAAVMLSCCDGVLLC